MQQRPNIFFRLSLASGALFVVNVLALTATIFSDPRAPSARFLENHGGTLIAVEVAATLIFAFWAMALDRRQQLLRDARAAAEDKQEPKEGS
jgi:hypothetical protein